MKDKVTGLLLVLGAVAFVFAGQRAATGGEPVATPDAGQEAVITDPHSDFGAGPAPVGAGRYTDAGNVTWTFGTPSPRFISRLAAVVVGDEMHIVTGEVQGTPNRAPDQIYDFTTGTWSDGLTHPGGGVSNANAIAVSDTLIVVGSGYLAAGSSYDRVSLLNLSANTWTAGAIVPQAELWYYAMAASGGDAYIFGGASQTTTFNKAYRYDPAANSFTTLADMPLALRSQVAAAAGDTVYLIGGQTAHGLPYNGTTNFLKYSISGDDWTTGPALPFAMSWGAGAAYNDPAHGWVIYVHGGYNAGGTIVNQVWAYTVATGTWEACNNLQTARRSHGGTVYRDTLLAVCGWASVFFNTVERGAIEPTAVARSFLWLHADYGPPDTTLGVRLQALGDTLVYMDVRSYTPTLSELEPYDAVGVHSNYPYDDMTALGNVLADYVDGGGGVVVGHFSFASGWQLAGRIMTGDYATVNVGANAHQATTLGWYDAAHPVMAGVGSIGEYFAATTSFASPDSVARWTDDRPYAAVSANRKVVGVNQYPGIHAHAQRTGDWALVIRNALHYVARGVGTEEGFDPFRPALSLQLDAAPNPAQRRVSVSWGVARAGRVNVSVYDANGRLVRTLFDGAAEPGIRTAAWDLTDRQGTRVAGGVYFCRLTLAGQTVSRKLVVE